MLPTNKKKNSSVYVCFQDPYIGEIHSFLNKESNFIWQAMINQDQRFDSSSILICLMYCIFMHLMSAAYLHSWRMIMYLPISKSGFSFNDIKQITILHHFEVGKSCLINNGLCWNSYECKMIQFLKLLRKLTNDYIKKT